MEQLLAKQGETHGWPRPTNTLAEIEGSLPASSHMLSWKDTVPPSQPHPWERGSRRVDPPSEFPNPYPAWDQLDITVQNPGMKQTTQRLMFSQQAGMVGVQRSRGDPVVLHTVQPSQLPSVGALSHLDTHIQTDTPTPYSVRAGIL